MSENYKDPSFKKLLEKLQEDSWQLELLISGFAIFGLFYAIEPVNNTYVEALEGGETIFYVLLTLVRLFLYIMIFNLILHIILRGLWIGALGLRYISGDIDYEALNYNKKFTSYLKRKVGSFDDYIGRLENYCSVIFAITFLLVFYVLALSIVVVIFKLIIVYILHTENLPQWISSGLGWILIGFMAVGSVLTFFDLVTGGFLKKNIKIYKFYFPFYLFFSFITLSSLYRPLIYNFLDDKFGKRVSLLLIPFYTFIVIMTSFYYQKSNFFSGFNSSNSIIANHTNYEDLKANNVERVVIGFTIQSKVITDSYLKIYLPYYPSYEDLIFKFNPDLEPDKDKRGFGSYMISSRSKSKKERDIKDSLQVEYLKTFNKIYKIKIDSTQYKTDFIIDKIKREKFGFESYIGIKNLSEGKHILTISKQIKKDSIGTKIVTEIPFWYFKK